MSSVKNSIIDLVGNTPLLKIDLKLPDVTAYVKMESFNPTGSIKDRACLYNIQSALKDGSLTKEKTILDASSGNMACSLAYFGHVLGYKVKVVCGSKLTEDKKDFIKLFGAELVSHGDFTIEGNQLCKEMSKSDSTYCFLDQLHNQSNPTASYETLAREIDNHLDSNLSAIIGSMGSGGSMCGVARYYKKLRPNVKIYTVQAKSGTKIPGTGAFSDGDYVTPFIKELRTLYDDTFFVSQSGASIRLKELMKMGVFTGLQAGGVLDGLLQAIDKYNLKGNVVMIIGDAGWKNTSKLKEIYK